MTLNMNACGVYGILGLVSDIAWSHLQSERHCQSDPWVQNQSFGEIPRSAQGLLRGLHAEIIPGGLGKQ